MSLINSLIRLHRINRNSNHHRIAEGFFWLSLFVLLGKLAGAAKEMAIAWRYGVSATVDAYAFLVNILSWPVSVWFSILTVVLVPLVARLRNDDPAKLPPFRSELLAFTLFLGVGLGALFWFVMPLVLVRGWLGLSGSALMQAVSMTGPLSIILPIGFLVSLFSAWMIAGGRHRNALIESLPAITMLFALLTPVSWLPEPLIWGTLVGIALQMLVLAWSLRRVDELNKPSFNYQSPVWQIFWGSIGILSISQFLSSFSGIIDQFFAASLSEGALATLNYSNRILALIFGVGAMAIGRATLPVFSEASVSGSSNVNSLALKWALWMFIGGIVIAAFGAIFSSYLVQFLFERGAFMAKNTHEVATVLRWSLIQVPFYFSCLVLVSALASGKQYGLIALSGISNLFFKLIFVLPLIKQYQLIGLVISTSAMYIISLVILYGAVRLVSSKESNRVINLK